MPQLLMAEKHVMAVEGHTAVTVSIATNTCVDALLPMSPYFFLVRAHSTPAPSLCFFSLLAPALGVNPLSSVSERCRSHPTS